MKYAVTRVAVCMVCAELAIGVLSTTDPSPGVGFMWKRFQPPSSMEIPLSSSSPLLSTSSSIPTTGCWAIFWFIEDMPSLLGLRIASSPLELPEWLSPRACRIATLARLITSSSAFLIVPETRTTCMTHGCGVDRFGNSGKCVINVSAAHTTW